jgi:hypothetical protein
METREGEERREGKMEGGSLILGYFTVRAHPTAANVNAQHARSPKKDWETAWGPAQARPRPLPRGLLLLPALHSNILGSTVRVMRR